MNDLSRCREVMRIVRDDATADAMALAGQVFNGKTVATLFGNTLAMVVALTETVDKVLDALEATR